MTHLTWRLAHEPGSAGFAALRELWRGDPHQNPFAAPSFLGVMHATVARTETQLWAMGAGSDGSLAAAWPLRVDRAGALRFLPIDYSDQRTCLALPWVSGGDLADGLALALQESRVTSLALTNVPPWGPTLGAAREALQRIGWSHRAFPAWPCPVLRVPPGPDADAALRGEVERHKRVRGYANALRREPGFAFEVLEDGSDLDAWCRDFCDTHERRWQGTHTPSTYRSAAAREIFRKVLGAWQADGVLVRFAIRAATGRIALVAALRAGGRLVYHHVATSPIAERQRAGHVLIRLIGLWISERGFHTLDFGAGGEEYKFRYANGNDALWRVFAAPSVASRSYLRALVEERIRRSPVLQRGWDDWVNRRFRGELRQRLAALAARSRSGGEQ